MTTPTEICEWLRAAHYYEVTALPIDLQPNETDSAETLWTEAADFIEAQAAEIERLMKERDEARLDSAGFKRVADDFTKIASHAQQAEITTSKRAEAAEAALEKMRSVEKIIEFWFAPWGSWKTETWEDMSGDQPYSADAALALIRAALTTQGGGE